MPLDPERPIEKLLRHAAAKRREEAGAPPALHPVTRRLLQAEVRKQYPPAAATTRPQRFSIFRPAWGWALGAATALLMLSGAILFLEKEKGPREQPMRLAMDREERFRAAVESAAAPAAPAKPALAPTAARAPTALAPAPTDSVALSESLARVALVSNEPALARAADAFSSGRPLVRSEVVREKLESTAVPAESPIAAAPASFAAAGHFYEGPTGGVGGTAILAQNRDALNGLALGDTPTLGVRLLTTNLVSGDTVLLDLPSASATPALNSPVALAAPLEIAASPTVELKRSLKTEPSRPQAGRTAQPLTGTAPLAKAKLAEPESAKGVAPVLASFQVEQSGQSLRIVDSDGSVYMGGFQVADADKSAAVSESDVRARRVTALTEQPRPAPTQAQPAPTNQLLERNQNLAFRVAGTNRSLRQNVVFTGNLAGPPLAQGQQFANNVSMHFANNTPQNFGRGSGGVVTLNRADSNAVFVAGKELRQQGQWKYDNQKQIQVLLQNSILGQAKLSDGRTVEVNASAIPANQK